MFKFAVGLILIGLVIGLSHLDVFELKAINCQLNHYPCPLQMEPVLLSFVGKNIFQFNAAAAKRQIMNFDPTLTQISVTKHLPNRLNIDLVRRVPVAVIQVQPTGPEFYLDKTGFIYTPSSSLNQSLPAVLWPGEVPLVEGESAMSLELAKLINTLAAYYVNFEFLTRLPEDGYLVKTTAGPEAVIPVNEDLASRVGSLQFILTNIKIGERNPTKIDLRFDKPILTY
ncbi:MAG: FtsQ-type POTRA domain-containing protein [Patescibacteria group bacterium]|nr:FtsQ-type POTRA domain-containing protein [Patescibacteria group bacterium]MDP4031086.1 FtsQ-type POTRA domain-containing protein [Candidatus Beckwithbacteria bacterium]MDZ4228774.1 FtsQ-type POTRA domain-containing protein [Patescibacteria group bacterium]